MKSKGWCFIGLLCLTLISGNVIVHPAYAKKKPTPLSEVQDLYYGKILYYFFQRKYLSSVTNLLIAQEKKLIPHHEDDAELLLGGLYLSYGLYNEAEIIFKRMVDKITSPTVRNRAWFYLAEVFYQRGHAVKARQALQRVEEPLPRDWRERKILLLSNILLHEQKYDEAIKTLKLLHSNSIWSQYGIYNLGIVLVKLNRIDDAIPLLNKLGELDTANKELKSLKDKANLALGYTSLQRKDALHAETYFQRVRLHGPFANQALYGMGQALYQLDNPQDALKYWIELQQRSTRGAGVLESMLSIGQAYIKLEAYPQALDHFDKTIIAYQEEIAQIDSIIFDIQKVKLLDKMLHADELINELDWLWRPEAIPDPLRRHYITQLLSTHNFNEALKTYRDLRFYQGHLHKWQVNMNTFDGMLTLRRQAFNEKLPLILQRYESLNTAAMQDQFNDLSQTVSHIENNYEPMKLATQEEFSHLARLASVKEKLMTIGEHLPPDQYKTFAHKFSLYRGLLIWQIMTDYKPRLHTVKDNLKELRGIVQESTKQRASLSLAQLKAPAQFDAFQNRIQQLKSRILALLEEIQKTALAQEQVIQNRALRQLQLQKKRIKTYLAQTQFAIAQIYDYSTTSDTEPTKETP